MPLMFSFVPRFDDDVLSFSLKLLTPGCSSARSM